MSNAPDVQVLGNAVLLQGRALRVVVGFAQFGATHSQSVNGTVLPDSTRALLKTLHDVAARSASALPTPITANEDARIRTADDRSCSKRMDSAAVAERLNVTPSHVRWLARNGRLPGHRVGKSWIFTTAAIEAYIEQTAREREQG